VPGSLKKGDGARDLRRYGGATLVLNLWMACCYHAFGYRKTYQFAGCEFVGIFYLKEVEAKRSQKTLFDIVQYNFLAQIDLAVDPGTEEISKSDCGGVL
jgi:hypothetical protein